MSYGIIRAWKGASEYERIEHFLQAILQTNKEYILKNCSVDIEFTDVVNNIVIEGVESLFTHTKSIWNLAPDGFEISEIELSYSDKSESASFILKTNNNEAVGLIRIEESNGRVSNCKLALTKPE